MGEIKQTNFRIDQDTATAFRKFCEDNGMNQAQGFDHVMQVVELDRAKTAAPRPPRRAARPRSRALRSRSRTSWLPI